MFYIFTDIIKKITSAIPCYLCWKFAATSVYSFQYENDNTKLY